MSNKRVLIDFASSLKLQLTESTGGQLIARGEFGRADVPTQNGRVYPRSLWMREVKRIQPAIAEGKVFCELDHPADGKTSLKRVGALLTGLELMDDGRIMGEAKILNNEHGRQLKSILEAGGAVGVSSRGMGSTAMESAGHEVVQDDYSYMTHDFVADPAVITSYPKYVSEVKWTDPNHVVTETKENAMSVEQKNEAVLVTPAILGKEEAPTAPAKDEVAAKEGEKPEVEKEASGEEEKSEIEKEEEAEEAGEVAAAVVADVAAEVSEMDKILDTLKGLLAPLAPKELEPVDAQIEAKNAEIKVLESKIESLGKICESFAAKLHLNESYAQLGEDLEEVKSLLEGKDLSTVESIDAALTEAKKMMAHKKIRQKKYESEMKKIEAKYEDRMKSLESKNQQLEEALKEAVKMSKELGVRVYVEERIRGNGNAAKIRELTEGKTERKEIDDIIKRFSVAPVVSEDYNSIRRRLSRHENTTLVENQLKKSGDIPSPSRDMSDVEKEVQELIPGASLAQVKAWM